MRLTAFTNCRGDDDIDATGRELVDRKPVFGSCEERTRSLFWDPISGCTSWPAHTLSLKGQYMTHPTRLADSQIPLANRLRRPAFGPLDPQTKRQPRHLRSIKWLLSSAVLTASRRGPRSPAVAVRSVTPSRHKTGGIRRRNLWNFPCGGDHSI